MKDLDNALTDVAVLRTVSETRNAYPDDVDLEKQLQELADDARQNLQRRTAVPRSAPERQAPTVTEYVVVYCEGATHGTLLLQLKDRPSWQQGKLNLPGGKMEETDGQDPLLAAGRELEEETGLVCAPDQLRLVGQLLGREVVVHCVRASVDPHQPLQPAAAETEAVGWYQWRDVSHDPRLLHHLRVMVPLLQDGREGWTIEVCEAESTGESVTYRVTLPGQADT